MCLAIYGKVLEVKDKKITVDLNGKKKEVKALIPVKEGDLVLIQAGFAIENLSK